MPVIQVLHDPAGVFEKKIYSVQEGTKLFNWLIEQYGSDGFDVPTTVFYNNVEIQLEDYIETGLPLHADVLIIHRPQGIDPITIAIIAVVSIAAVSALVPTPTIPEFKESKESPNNSLSGQTNIARPLQRIPDLYGTNRVYPDLILKTYFEYINHVKYQIEYLCVGRGEYLLEEFKSGDTLINSIDGASYSEYGPNTIASGLKDVRTSNEVNGQELIGPNNKIVNIDDTTVSYTANNTIYGSDPQLREFQNMTAGQTFVIDDPTGFAPHTYNSGGTAVDFSGDEITVTPASEANNYEVGKIITISGTSSNNGYQKIDSIDGGTGVITCVDPVTGAATAFTTENTTGVTLTTTYKNLGTFTFASYAESIISDITYYTITVSETTFDTLSSVDYRYESTNYKDNEIGPFTLSTGSDSIWFDIEAPRGVHNNNGLLTLSLTIRLQQIDSAGTPIGAAENTAITIKETSIDPRFYTYKITPAVTGSGVIYEASVIKNTNDNNSSSVGDLLKWTRLAGVRNVSVSDFGNVTTVLLQTIATEQATSLQERKFNVIATRKLPTYGNSTPSATAKVADAVYYLLTDQYGANLPESQIDLAGLYAIQSSLDSDSIYGDKLGRFCYSFSNANTSVHDELKTMLTACRMFYYIEGNVMKFGRDEVQQIRTSVLTRRIKKPDSERKTTRYTRAGDEDGVSLEYIDERTGSASTLVFPETLTPIKPKRIEAAGIKNYEQAWNRGKIEYNKLVYQRTVVSTVVLKDGFLLAPNDRVGNVDGTDINAQDGEVISLSGFTVTTIDAIDFEGNTSASVILRDESGNVSSPIVCTPRTDGGRGFVLGSLPGFTIYTRESRSASEYQIVTTYDFSPDNTHAASDYLVQKITPNDDGYVNLELVNYTPEIYNPDTETPT